jgi:hypothetical protein
MEEKSLTTLKKFNLILYFIIIFYFIYLFLKKAKKKPLPIFALEFYELVS